jgi:hypothetical protein
MDSTLFKVEGAAEGLAEPLVELARARSPQEAAEIIHEFFLWLAHQYSPLSLIGSVRTISLPH